MNTKLHTMRVGGLRVNVVRKDIKNLHVAVYPPAGRVRVAAPLRVTDEAIRLAVITRLAWIKRQQAKFTDQERQSKREYVTGESHYFQGQRYRLDVVYHDGRPRVAIRGNHTIDLFVRNGSDTAQRERVLLSWYRKELKLLLPALIQRWEPVLGVRMAEAKVKHMKTKWGTCNARARRIWINLELAKKPVQCLEYVLVHEMVHLLERNHTDRFTVLMDRAMPSWRLYREELNRAPLRHESWSY